VETLRKHSDSAAAVTDRISNDEWSSSILSRLSQMKSVLSMVDKLSSLTPSPPVNFKNRTDDLLSFLSAKRVNSARLASTRQNAISFLSQAELCRTRNIYARRTISLSEALSSMLIRFGCDSGLYASCNSTDSESDSQTRTISFATSGDLFCLVLDIMVAETGEAGVESISLIRLAQGDEMDVGNANEHLQDVLALKGSHATALIPELATVEQKLSLRPFTPYDAVAALFRVLTRIVAQVWFYTFTSS